MLSKNRNIIYYAHPLELYDTYFEDLLVSMLQREIGEVYQIKTITQLKFVINKEGQKILEQVYKNMKSHVFRNFSDISIEKIAHNIIDTLKSNLIIDIQNILFNPSIFSPSFDRFIRMTFPEFCEFLISDSDMVVAHGYPLNNDIKQLLSALLTFTPYNKRIDEYCQKVQEIIANSENMIWSPGVLKEIEYALNEDIKSLSFLGEKFKSVSEEDINKYKNSKIPFDDDGLKFYKKIWQPISNHVFSMLTKLYGKNYFCF